MRVELAVNGATHALEVEPRMSLLARAITDAWQAAHGQASHAR